jgi:uncharacterized protein (DUF1330 family)
MTAYAIVRVAVHDPEQYEQYKALTPAAVAAFGGKFVVRGGEATVIEGPEEHRRIVVVEFSDAQTAADCFASDLYQEAKSKRIGAADMEMIIVEGA